MLALSLEGYQQLAVALAQRECEASESGDTFFSLRPTQLEILRAAEGLVDDEPSRTEARRKELRKAVERKTDVVSPRWNAAHEGSMVSILRFVASTLGGTDVEGEGGTTVGDGFRRLLARLDAQSAWKAVSPVRVPVDAVEAMFQAQIQSNGRHGKGLKRAKELYRSLEKAIRISNDRGGVAREQPQASPVPGSSAGSELVTSEPGRVIGIYLCIGWRIPKTGRGTATVGSQAGRVQIETVAGPFRSEDSLLFHQLSEIIGYDLSKCAIAKPSGVRCIGCTCSGWECEKKRYSFKRWTVVLLRRWLVRALTREGGCAELRVALRTALDRLDDKRAESSKEAAVAFLWRAESAEANPVFAATHLLQIWQDRAAFRNRPEKGGRAWKKWMIAYRENLAAYRKSKAKPERIALEPHEWWMRGW